MCLVLNIQKKDLDKNQDQSQDTNIMCILDPLDTRTSPFPFPCFIYF